MHGHDDISPALLVPCGIIDRRTDGFSQIDDVLRCEHVEMAATDRVAAEAAVCEEAPPERLVTGLGRPTGGGEHGNWYVDGSMAQCIEQLEYLT